MSPTINLWMKPKDFIKYCSNLKHYSQCKLEFLDSSLYLSASEKYPVACLDDIIIYFLHYASEEDARQKWEERTNRINYDNVRCILSERDGCTYDDLENFLQHHWFIVLFLVFPIRAIYEDLKTRYN